MDEKMDLTGKIAVITGGSRGIGKAIALCLAKAGADIIVNYKNNKADCDNVIESIRTTGRKALGIKADVASKDEVDAMVAAAIKEFGKIDILINNAGGSRKSKVVEMEEREWDEIINFNLKGPFLCTKAVLPYMIQNRSGKIINISSNYGVTPAYERSHYAAAKAGLIAFSKSLAMEVAPYDINVNVIAPGPTDTPRWRNKHTREWILNRGGQVPLGRVAQPEDVASCALFLVSENSSYITGQTIHVSGGLVMP